jgi:hypothetical protein
MAAAPTPPAAPPTSKLAQLLPNLTYGAVAVLILGMIIWGLWGKGGFLSSLSDMAVARGLITFLITFTTVGIAIILAISTIFSSTGDDEDKRFDKGKQVLSVLIGILGTIVGFYFGSSTDVRHESATGEARTLAIAPANVSNLQPKKGEKFTISSFVSGGKPPYSYSVTFDSLVLPAIKDATSLDGIIKQEIAVPDSLSSDVDIKYQITVTDSEKKAGDYNKDGAQTISLKTK